MTPEGYNISRSVRLRSSASAYFNRTFASAPTSTTKQSFSFWLKRGSISSAARQNIFAGYDGSSSNNMWISFETNDILYVASGGTLAYDVSTTQVFRDPSAWYHFVIAFDTTQATASNRVKIYVNGVQVTSLASSNYPPQNQTLQFGIANANNKIGTWWHNTVSFLDGYLTEVNFIDGQALTPSSFGETDAATGVWKPKKYAGTYGTNGFYLNFSDPSAATAAAICKDYSGNGNNWTPNNISVTAGVTYDSMFDVPTPYADGGNGRGNYCVLNGANNGYGTTTLSQGNLYSVISAPGATEGSAIGSIGMSTGKWYWEINVVSANTTYGYPCSIGIGNQSSTNGVGTPNASYTYNSKDGNKMSNTGSFSSVAYGASYTANDVIGVAFDADAGTLTFYKNNTSQGVAFTGITSSTWFARVGSNDGCTVAFNFGQRPFAYTPPTGFKALNTQNLPDATIKKGSTAFNTVLYTGNGGNQVITGVGFQPDLVWGKLRSTSGNHRLQDSSRGSDNTLSSNLTDAEVAGNGLVSFDADGFTMDSGTNINQVYPYVAWNWKKGATQGFDIVTYTGDGTSAHAISHSLGVAPKMVIVKSRSLAGENWNCWHTSLNNTAARILLNTTGAVDTGSPSIWGTGGINPTSTTFQVGSSSGTNGNTSTYVAYLFSEVAGFSKFGSYTGNGSADGPFVYCGFRPRFVLVKGSSNASSWQLFDTSRNTYNAIDNTLWADLSSAEGTGYARIDLLSNGFKVRAPSGADPNVSGATYIFMALAENPFKNSLAR